jgi:hypothetical protein
MTRTQHTLSGTAPFAALAEELAELGFETGHYDTPGPRQYTATDSPMQITIDDSRRPPRAVLASGEDGPAWHIELRGDVPDGAQVMTLYAALHPDNIAAAARAATGTAHTTA